MDAGWFVVIVAFFDPVYWIIGGLAGWIIPHRWFAAATAAGVGLAVAAILLRYAHAEVFVASAIVPAVIAFSITSWRQYRRRKRAASVATADTATEPKPKAGNPSRLIAKRVDGHLQLLAAMKLTGPIKQNVLVSFRPLRASNLFDLNFDDLTNEVISHLVTFHAVLVLEQPSPLPMAAFALGRTVAHVFNDSDEDEQQRACAIALGDVLKHAMSRTWADTDQDLLASATEAFFAWDKRPNRMNLGPLFD